MYHILYNPGACGDMVAAVIDSKDHFLSDVDIQHVTGSLRQKLKQDLIDNQGAKNLLFSNFKKTDYLLELEKHYLAITASHDFHEGLQYLTDTILIDDSEYKYAKWCMERCHLIRPQYHPPFNEETLQYRIHHVKVAKKHGQINKIIPLKDILEGRLIEKLQQWIDTPLNIELYNHWLHKIIAPLPKVD